MSSNLERALAAIDRLHDQDPNREQSPNDKTARPAERVYAERMTAWLLRLSPEASEALQLAARAQHLCRWRRPRDAYPMTREGYRAWRTAAAQEHAMLAAECLRSAGYDDETVARVRSLVQKRKIKQDPEAQTLEDAACLVFLEHYLAAFVAKHSDEKLKKIIRRTWAKMSPRAHAEALMIAFSPKHLALVQRALGDTPA